MKQRIIKTVVPYFVGLVVSLLATVGIEMDEGTRSSLVQVLTFAVGTAYYLVVVWLTKRFPWAEKLLGSSKSPEYK